MLVALVNQVGHIFGGAQIHVTLPQSAPANAAALQGSVSRFVGQRKGRNRRALPLPAQRPDAGPGWRRVGTKHSSFYRFQGNSHDIATILP